MLVTVKRLSTDRDATVGIVTIDNSFQCFSLEDEARDIKIAGETRIPAGVYQLGLRTEGGMTKKYSRKFPGFHKGMLHLKDVYGFEYVYIHIGNTDDHTEGCILVGNTVDITENKKFLGKSTEAYISLYQKIVHTLESGEEVVVSIVDEYNNEYSF